MHKQNLVFKAMLEEKSLKMLSKVLVDYGKIIKFFGNSTKKIRQLKEIEIDLDILEEVNFNQRSVKKELRKLSVESKEAETLLEELSAQEKVELELASDEAKIEEAIMHDTKLDSL